MQTILLTSMYLYPYNIHLEHLSNGTTFRIVQLKDVPTIERRHTDEALELRLDPLAITVERYQDVAGKVKVRSKQAALELVRLFTSASTCNLFCTGSSIYIEPCTEGSARGRMYGNPIDRMSSRGSLAGYNGIFDERSFRKAAFPPTNVDFRRGEFHIIRTLLKLELVKEDFVHQSIIRVRETVLANGTIRRETLWEKPSRPLTTYRSPALVRGGGLVKWE